MSADDGRFPRCPTCRPHHWHGLPCGISACKCPSAFVEPVDAPTPRSGTETHGDPARPADRNLARLARVFRANHTDGIRG